MRTVSMPLAPAGSVQSLAPPVVEVHGSRLAGLTVLCVDNDTAVLEGMRVLLAGWKCRVVAGASADEALVLLSQASLRPDVMLVDYHLDHGTGLDAIKIVRAHLGSDIPALVITADTSAELHRQVREMGYGLLKKPVKVAALRAALTQVSAQAAAAAAE